MTKHQIHANTLIGYVRIKVSNMARSIAFYQEIIGLDVKEQVGNVAYLTAKGDVNPILVLEEVADAIVMPEPRPTTGLFHFAILVPTRESLGITLRHLLEKRVGIGQADHIVSEALYLSDPDNNGIEIYWDRPREDWKRDSWGNITMATDPIDWEGLLALAEQKPWTGLPSGTTIGHIHLQVADIEQAKQFYCDVMGFDLITNYGNRALFISAGGYHHHIGMNTWAGVGLPVPPANATGLDYYSLIIPDQAALDATIARLGEAGAEVTKREDGYLVRDTSGISILLSV
ncbi:VOC family protein [Paenibacillus sp. N1-5-1-14]|uniref:VOC family protein n=1 Tax=Paenibacillus radicibacter TaxID=2972488 RepID=UPI002158FAFB|nr:VOC family protein [Paenibacillus radicibacter]MCR8641194.1 VOC family protein [Paenibacillus radicibacter]